ncbi:MAG: NUDIX domain-containing protein [Patescibacteria group bacterium]|nr:NUDIX domain-containing protein [Patescibacteria group bacterium]MDD5121478.1 NUDIX domain-containing protein [Patescibacteria group bacterium]MDD5221950.1 NUDIX domain-containing protein [Patescibacteria group bacterium]MDD5396360.1 NUDIX domain-containing protein [Patescibacteria group bacterium]
MADHYVDVVDENDEVIGKELKSKKPELNFISRVVAIFVRDSNNRFVVSKRASHKKLDADKYDLSAFGNVDAGEDYETAAKRELMEELGIDCELKMLDKFYQENEYNGKRFKIFCGVFLAETDQEPKLNHELVSYSRMTFNEIEQGTKENHDKFCEGFRNDFERVKDLL